MNPTNEQLAIIDADVRPGGVLKCKAYAGTGKTSTLVEVAKKSPDDVLYLAFNSSVAKDAAMRFPMNTESKTVHSLAYKFVGFKYKSNLRNIYNYNIKSAYGLSLYESSLLLKSLENFLNSAEDKPADAHVHPDELKRLDPDKYTEAMVYRLGALFGDMVEGRKDLPMTHSGYLKLFGLQRPKLGYPTVLLDEAQDTNPVTLRIVLDQMESGSRVYFVGDPYQQIYSWRGALDAMEDIEAPELRITQSFRFGTEVAWVASKLLNTFFREQVPLTGLGGPDSIETVEGKHTCLCRTNAGLVREAYASALADARIHVVGEGAFQTTLTELDDIYALYTARRKDIINKRFMMHASYDKMKEYADEALDVELKSKIQVIDEHGSEWPTVRAAIVAHLKAVSEADVIFTTTHKAKGLEWDNVRLAEDFSELYYPSIDHEGRPIAKLKTATRNPKDESEIHSEEVNLLYVAATRAKRVLQPTTHLRRLLREDEA